MKRLKKYSYRVLGILIALGMVACMGESEEKVSYQRYGVATIQPSPSLFTTDGKQTFQITSAALDTLPELKEGDCFLLKFRAELPEYAEKEIYPVDILSMEPIGRWTLEKTDDKLPDTTFVDVSADSSLVHTVQFFTPTINKSQLIHDHLFVQLTLTDRRLTQTEKFVLQYNPEQVTEKNGQRIYDLFLRGERHEASDSLLGKWIQTEALVLDQFIQEAGQAEKQIGNDSLHLRLNYPTSFSLDSTLVRWTAANIYSIVL